MCGVVTLEVYCTLFIGNNPNAPTFPIAGNVSVWQNCILASPTSLILFQFPVAVLKHYAIEKQQPASQVAQVPPVRGVSASLAATILIVWVHQHFLPKFLAWRSCSTRSNSRGANVSLPKPQKWQCTSLAAWTLPLQSLHASVSRAAMNWDYVYV